MVVSFYSSKMEIGRDVKVPEDVVERVQAMWINCSPEVRAIFGYSFYRFIEKVFEANYWECGDAWTIQANN